MFKPSQCLQARLRLTTKQVNGGYYKGNRTGSMGYFRQKKGEYVIDWTKVRTYVAPNLDGFELSPFVTKAMEPTKGVYTKNVVRNDMEVQVPRAPNAEDFLQEWIQKNKGEAWRLWQQERKREKRELEDNKSREQRE